MNKFSKFIVLSCVLLSMLACLAGCGGGGTKTKDEALPATPRQDMPPLIVDEEIDESELPSGKPNWITDKETTEESETSENTEG